MKKEKNLAAIFDLDGTLLNSGREGYRRLIALAKQWGIEITNEIEAKLHDVWGLDPENLIIKGFEVPLNIAKEIHEAWIIWDSKEPIPLVTGVPAMLQKNLEGGVFNFVFTSREKESAMNVLKSFKIIHYFEDVVGIDGGVVIKPTGFKKPDPKAFGNLLQFIEETYLIKRKNIVYVGDEKFDIQCGMGAGIRTYGVTSGLKSADELIAVGALPDHIFPTVAHINF